jgi:peptide chain release factor 3
MNNRKIIGTVGALQYEVIQYLEHEYGANVREFPVHKACWVKPMMQRIMNSKNLNELNKVSSKRQIRTIGLSADRFYNSDDQNKYPSVKLYFTSEFE